MYLVNISPISRASRAPLTYFSREDIEDGSIVSIPLRTKKKYGISLSCTPLAQHKADLRKASYTIKKILPQEPLALLPKSFASALGASTHLFATTPGALFYELLPQTLLEELTLSPTTETRENSGTVSGAEGTFSYRLAHYAECAQKAHKNNTSVLIVCPSSSYAKSLHRTITEEWEVDNIQLLASPTNKKKEKQWRDNLANASDTPGVFVGTYSTLSLFLRGDISCAIVEEAGSSAYKQMNRPHFDFRIVARELSNTYKSDLIYGDMFIPHTHSLQANSTKETTEPAATELIEMKPIDEEHGFSPLSPQAQELLSSNSSAHTLLYTTRTGLYPLTSCNDCGTVVSCPTCSYPLVMHEKEDTRRFRCHKCKKNYPSNIKCHVCKGWNFALLGIGIQALEKEVRKLCDSDIFSTYENKAHNVVKKWQEKGGILIAHEPALAYLTDTWDTSIISSLDTLASIPDIGMEEKIARILLTLRAGTKDSLLLQTRTTNPLLPKLLKEPRKDIHEYVRTLQKSASLPPYSHFIKLSWEKRKSSYKDSFSKYLKDYSTSSYETLYKNKRGKFIEHLLISLPSTQWSDEYLIKFLGSLPRDITVDVYPESIL